MKGEQVVMNWSSGKDDVLACHIIKQLQTYEVKQLLTTISEEQATAETNMGW